MAELHKLAEARINEDYIVAQVNSYRKQEGHRQHKQRLTDFDELYEGHIDRLFPDEEAVPERLLIENKLKNATHDIARLASEARASAVFLREKEGKSGQKDAQIRSVITQTLWQMMKGRKKERKFYFDLIAAGMAIAGLYFNGDSDYPQMLRMDPRFSYPSFRNDELQSMIYVETIKEREAARIWTDLGLDPSPDNSRDVTISTYYDDEEVVTSVHRQNGAGQSTKATHVTCWKHELDCIPVAFVALDSPDSRFHGLFDQLSGPMMVQSKTVRLLVDYLESMVHAPWEAKNILNTEALLQPGPLTVIEHDPNTEGNESFARRLPPAAPAGAVFGLLQNMQGEVAAEAVQPASRVGNVRQSIASGSFVESTQGTLSSVVLELQECMSELRYEINCIAFKIDAKHLNKEKPMIRAVGQKQTYTPKEDMGDFYYHTIQFGAGAGLSRAEAANRVQLDLGAGLVSKELAREQIPYIDDVTAEQTRIEREQLANVFFQRFSTDPNTKMSLIARSIIEMGKGKDFLDVIEELAPEMVADEAPAPAPEEGGSPDGVQQAADAQNPDEAQATLEAGGQLDLGFAPPPLQQQIVRNTF